MTIKQLQRTYRRFNKKYFDGRLPAEIAMSFEDMGQTPNGGLCTTYQEPGLVIHTIHLDKQFQSCDTLLEFFLLHEMNHIDCPGSPDERDYPHGKSFDEGMARLAFRGAFHLLW